MDLKNAVRSVLQLLGIRRVVVVDDSYGRQYPVEEIVGILAACLESENPPVLAEIFGGAIDFSTPRRVWQRSVAQYWADLDDERRLDILARVHEVTGTSEQQPDVRYASTLKRILDVGRKIEVLELTPQQWVEQKAEVLRAAAPDAKVLILFDWDLGSLDGTTFLKEVYNAGLRQSVVLGLLSGKFPIEAEREVAKANLDVPLSSCLPLSKERIITASGGKFAEGLKLAALNSVMEQLMDEAHSVAAKAVAKSDNDLRGLYPYDLVHVFEYSNGEGVWEAETVLRFLDICYRDNIREIAEATTQKARFDSLTHLINDLAKVAVDEVKADRPSSRVRELRRRELYCPADLINSLLTPIRLGDIFEVRGKPYILLAQPCDLMIRSGQRLQHVQLVEIRPDRKAQDQDGPSFYGNLDLFNGTDRAYVWFKHGLTVPTVVLDMAAFSETGSCTIPLNGEPHRELSRRMRKLYKDVQAVMRSLSDNLGVIDKHVPTESQSALRSALLNVYLASGIGEPVIDNDILSFPGVRRIGHYREDMATLLLGGFSGVGARPAKPGDFAAER